MKLVEFEANSFDAAHVAATVLSGNICVIHGVLSAADAGRAVTAVLAWSKAEPAFDTRGGAASPAPLQNFHRVDNNPALSATKHIFHTFNFENLAVTEQVLAPVVNLFEAMYLLDNKLVGSRGNLTPSVGDTANFHPQIIHYPRGGGYFDRHTHALEPQKIGLIASLTRNGEHFDTGGTLFWGDGGELDAEPAQTIGSVTLFRFDLPHAVSKVDPAASLEFGKPTGRWVAVLPYR
jgi:hypothetical protein